MHLLPGGVSGDGAAIPIASGRVERVAAPGQSISLGQKGLRFQTSNTRSNSNALLRHGGGTEELASQVWQTFACDTSGLSGAEAAIVIVGGALHMGDRQRVYTLNLGNIASENVFIDETGFIVQPALRETRLVGRCIFPEGADISVETNDAGQTSIAIRITELDEQVGGLFADSAVLSLLNAGSSNAGSSSAEANWNDGLADIQLASDAVLDENQRIAATALEKLYRVSTSSKMGDPSRRERVESQFVLVLLLCRDEAPAVSMLGPERNALFSIGDQAVTYWEHFVEFAHKNVEGE